MKKVLFSVIAVFSLILTGCKESIDTSARYVFTDQTIISYLEKHPETYSEYLDILQKIKAGPISETSVYQLLTARGHYTVFAPTNDAIHIYLEELKTNGLISDANWDAFPDQATLDSIRTVIAYNSVIDGGDYLTYETGAMPTKNTDLEMSNMYDRKLSLRWGPDGTDSIYISDAPMDMDNRNIPAINGVIHAMTRVVAPSNNTVGYILSRIVREKREGYFVAAMLADAVGLLDSLSNYRDENYEILYQTGKVPVSSTNNGETFYSPEHRYFGFTYFAETDEVWAGLLGKSATSITVEDVVAYLDEKKIYPEAKRNTDYHSEDNLLNQFVTYHLLPMYLPNGNLVYHYNERGYNLSTKTPTVPVMEFYTTMGKRRLLKIYESKESNGIYLNRFPELDTQRGGTYHELSVTPETEGLKVGEPETSGEMALRNGIIYPLDKLLVYDDETRNQLQKGRIRWNVTAMWPEFMTNSIRCSNITDAKHKNVFIPSDDVYKYLNDVEISKETEFYYWTGRGNGWMNMQGDEMTIRGLFEVTMRLPPVPKRGTYELRFAIQSGGNMRGMSQFYWGSDPDRLAAMGIPMDLRQGAYYRHTSAGDIPSDIGFELDSEDQDYNSEVDKRMRNNGFMKGCMQYCAGAPGTDKMMRQSDRCIRRIILRETMDPDKTYYIKFKTVMDDPTRYFYMDYLEYCAKEVFDNPETPEDIW